MPLEQSPSAWGDTVGKSLVAEAKGSGSPVAQAGTGGLVGEAAGPLAKRVSQGRWRISLTKGGGRG
jgi:hypothetical protein